MASKVALVHLFSVVLSVSCLVASLQAASTSANSLSPSGVSQSKAKDDCAKNQVCVAEVKCKADLLELAPCSTADNTLGICCSISDPNHKLWARAVEDGRREFEEKLDHVEKHRHEMTAKDKPASVFHKLFKPAGLEKDATKTDPKERADVYGSVFASRKYAEMANLTKEERQGGRFARHLAARWPRQIELGLALCDPNSRYRTYDGTCNNPVPERASWGCAEYPFEKLLAPAYEDGVWAPR